MQNKNIIGERLKKCRKQSGLKQDEVAKELQVQRQIISYYETGTRQPNIDDIVKLAKLYNTSTDYLLGLSENQTTNKDVKAICNYTGLNENVICELNSKVNSMLCCKEKLEEYGDAIPFDDFDYYIGEESIHEIETLNYLLTNDFFYSCLNDIGSYNSFLVDAIERQEFLIKALQSEMTEDNKNFIYQAIDTINELYHHARYNYLNSLEVFRDSLSSYTEKEKEYFKNKDDISELFILSNLTYRGEI